MEFNEKLQQLRKDRGITQEELAQSLYVSRTAVSKWESGRGYPSIDSLKQIAEYFSVTVDDLLSGDKIISLAERENKSRIKNICDLFIGIADLFCLVLILLPIYSNPVGERVYTVNLLVYLQKVSFNHMAYWAMFAATVAVGIAKIVLSCLKTEKYQRALTVVSMLLGMVTVLLLAMTREAYAVCVSFLLLIIKGILILKYVGTN